MQRNDTSELEMYGNFSSPVTLVIGETKKRENVVNKDGFHIRDVPLTR